MIRAQTLADHCVCGQGCDGSCCDCPECRPGKYDLRTSDIFTPRQVQQLYQPVGNLMDIISWYQQLISDDDLFRETYRLWSILYDDLYKLLPDVFLCRDCGEPIFYGQTCPNQP